MLTHALLLAASLMGASNTADPGARAAPLPEATYTRVNTDQQVYFVLNDKGDTYWQDSPDGTITVRFYKLPCFLSTYLMKELAPRGSFQPDTYAVATIQNGGQSLTIEHVGEKTESGYATVGFQPNTDDESQLGNAFCAKVPNMAHLSGTTALMFQLTSY